MSDQDEGLQASEQWFRLYGTAKDGDWGPVPNEPLHVHHPDAYNPDARVRIRHHRAALQAGTAKAACGKDVDMRTVYIEEHDKTERCPKCVAVTEAAASGKPETVEASIDALPEALAATDKPSPLAHEEPL